MDELRTNADPTELVSVRVSEASRRDARMRPSPKYDTYTREWQATDRHLLKIAQELADIDRKFNMEKLSLRLKFPKTEEGNEAFERTVNAVRIKLDGERQRLTSRKFEIFSRRAVIQHLVKKERGTNKPPTLTFEERVLAELAEIRRAVLELQSAASGRMPGPTKG
jgi:hypothetical protein